MRDEIFAYYAEIEELNWWFVGRRRIMRALIEKIVPPDIGAAIVDVGCGTGANIASLADRYRCTGIDPAPAAIRYARARFPGVTFCEGFAPADLPAEARAADLWLLMDVLEHVPDDYAFLSNILAAMKPGAHILLTVPADMRLWTSHDVTQSHYRRYEREGFAAVWTGLPVSVRLYSHFVTRLYPVVRAVRAVNRLRGKASGGAGTDLSLPPRPVNAALTAFFAGETARLVGTLDTGVPAYRRGVSLVAVLRREDGTIEPRARPADIPPDPGGPHAG